MSKFLACSLVILVVVITWAAIAMLSGLLFMWLWNATMPELFGLSAVTYWQSVGIWALLYMIGGAFAPRVSSSNSN